MEYEQQQIKPLLEDTNKHGFKIKILSDNNETKWFNINKEILMSLYNSFN